MIRFIFTLMTVLLFFPVAASANSSANYVSKLSDCNAELPQLSLYTILDKGRNTLAGWSHIRTNKEGGEFRSLSLSDADYAITQDYYVADKSCGYAKVQNGILAVKLSDSTRQHSNGIEASIDANSISFGEVGYVLLDLKVNRIGSSIPSLDALRTLYRDFLTEEEFEQFDLGMASLGITLFSQSSASQASEPLNAELLFSIDQEVFFDQWLRVILPLDEFQFYIKENSVRVPQERSSYKASDISGFRINPETSHGRQLREILGDKWSEHIPEAFKEISISLRRIELLKRR